MTLWLKSQDNLRLKRTGKLTLVLGTILLVFTIVSVRWPGVLHLGKAVSHSVDRGGDIEAELLETPHEVPCLPPFFIGRKGVPRYWRDPWSRPVRCFDRAGRIPDSKTEAMLIPLRGDGIALIEKDAEELRKRQQVQITAPSTLPSPPPVRATTRKKVHRAPTPEAYDSYDDIQPGNPYTKKRR